MNITENCKLEMENVISYRGKITQQQMSQIVKEMEQIISENSAEKKGYSATATFAIENNGAHTVMDVEILIPLNKEITVPSGYSFKSTFRLNNAVKVRHEGNPALLQNSANELMKYITDHKLIPITTGYNVTVREPANQNDIDSLIVDMYVGVSDNIL